MEQPFHMDLVAMLHVQLNVMERNLIVIGDNTMQIVTANSERTPIDVLEQEAIKLLLSCLIEFDPEPHQTALLHNVYHTLYKQLKEK